MRAATRCPSTLPPVDVAGVITLDQVRPHPRKQNEYVDTPHSPLVQPGKHLHSHCPGVSSLTARDHVALPHRSSHNNSSISIVIRKQPSTSPPLKKDLLSTEPRDDGEGQSIICSNCQKCKCGACTNPRDLPSKWLCGGKFNVSPEAAVEYATCVCCVKGVFYHCSKDDGDGEFECVTDPCAGCSRPHCCKRWTCILAMSLCLPCMCLYPPAKLGLMCCTSLYNKCRKKGCTCKSTTSNQTGKNTRSNKSRISKFDSTSQCRGLLIESDRESSSLSNS